MKSPREVILVALNNYGSDDLERAEMAFKYYSQEQLNKEYCHSGKTCREILDGYRVHRQEVENAIRNVKEVYPV